MIPGTLVAVWESGTGKEKQPNKGFIAKQVTIAGIWTLTPLGDSESQCNKAPHSCPPEEVRGAAVFIH